MCLVMVEEDLSLWNSVIELLGDELHWKGIHTLTGGSKILVLLLTDMELLENHLREGKESYLTKPVLSTKLLDRIKVLIRESEGLTINPKIEYRGIQLFSKEHSVSIGGNSIQLTAKEYGLLEYLIQNKGVILTKEQIYDRIWGLDSETAITIVEVFIHHLRKKLEPFGYNTKIKTVRGVGYMLNA